MDPIVQRWLVAGLAVLGASLTISCTSHNPSCTGEVKSAAQTGTTWTATGDFGDAQPLMVVTLPAGGQMVYVSNSYSEVMATFDVGNLPLGSYPVTWELSCLDGGQHTISGPSMITVK